MAERKLAGNTKILLKDVRCENLRLLQNVVSLHLEVVSGQKRFFQMYDERQGVIKALKQLKATCELSEDQIAALGEEEVKNTLRRIEKEVFGAFFKNASVFFDVEEDRKHNIKYPVLIFREPELQKPEFSLSAIRFYTTKNAQFWTRQNRDSWAYFVTRADRDGEGNAARTDFLLITLTSPSSAYSVLHQEDKEDGRRVEILYLMNSRVNVTIEAFIKEVSDKKISKTTETKKK